MIKAITVISFKTIFLLQRDISSLFCHCNQVVFTPQYICAQRQATV